jgi:signal transduction histidine kinase
MGPERAEWFRLAVNVPGMWLHGYLVGWSISYWLWLPFLALLNEASRLNHPHRRGLSYLVLLVAVPLLAGATWQLPALFAAISIFLHGVSVENARFARVMLEGQAASLRELRQADRAAEARATERDAANHQLEERLAELNATQRQLLEASRRVGMAEVATSVLHNVGNVLNSVNVSAGLLADILAGSRLTRLLEAIAMLRAQQDPARFLEHDPRGRRMLAYLGAAGDALNDERSQARGELACLIGNIDHIKHIVQVQQIHARSGGAIEPLDLADLLDEGLDLNAASNAKHGIRIERDYDRGVRIESDRHRILHILLNLLGNAAQAIKAGDNAASIVVRVRDAGDRVAVEVEDSGVGISIENMPKIFQHGFTTKRDGHGFGLHASACTAAELGGALLAQSDGHGRGARFTLLLPRRLAASGPTPHPKPLRAAEAA